MNAKSVLEQGNEIKSWVDFLGFQFNPFKHLDASNDPHLGEYIVDLEKFTGVWESQPALIFAPAGGGKTTLRIYSYRACWAGRDGLHPFPIQYYLPLLNDHIDWAGSLEQDLERAAAHALLISLSFRPERLKNTPRDVQENLAAFLLRGIGRDTLLHYLSVLEHERDPKMLAEQAGRIYVLPDPPAPDLVEIFYSTLLSNLPKADSTKRTSLEDTKDRIRNLIIKDLEFECIYLLIDGVDGFADTVNEPQKASEQVNLLLQRTKDWEKIGIYVKVFLPEETETQIRSNLWKTHINWTPDSLAKIIKQRIRVASRDKFGSLNGVSSPGLRNDYIEQILAQNIIPLPREIIFATQQLFQAYEGRSLGAGKIEPEDLQTALEKYREDLRRRHIELPNPIYTVSA